VANLTLTIDERLLRAARIRALEQGTSVNALVRSYLEHFAGEPAHDAIAAFLRRSAHSAASSGEEGRTWMRDELHER
jgi:hypothetical protein